MILQEYIEIKIASKNMQYYKDLGYDCKNVNDIIIVKNKDLPMRSKIKEIRQCDFCGKISERKHSCWMESLITHKKDCCAECGRKLRTEHIKETNLKKYGVEFPMQSKEIKQKAISSTMEHYGCEYSFQNKEVRKKAMSNIESIYGSMSNMANNEDVKKKRSQTNLTKYGKDNTFQVDAFKQKSKETINEKYGCDYITQSQEIRDKIQNTFQTKYGADCALQVEEFKNKAIKTTMERYGVEYAMQNKDVKAKANNTMCLNGSVPTSSQQLAIFDMLKNYYGENNVMLNYPLSQLALDIVLKIDEFLIDIEYDGAYWHQDKNKDRKRDEFVKENGYKILRIESEKSIPTIEQINKCLEYLKEKDNEYCHIEI